MRALFYKDIKTDEIVIQNEAFHHLKNVLRVKISQDLLLLDGDGRSRLYFIEQIDRKSIFLKSTTDIVESNSKPFFSVAIGHLKKEAMDLSLKQSVELGARIIYILSSDYSQNYKFNMDRAIKIIVSALEQSNSRYLPKIKLINLSELLEYEENIFYLTLGDATKGNDVENFDQGCLLIGPEGGFSDEEDRYICQNFDPILVQLKTNILRAPTALACGFGYILSKK